MNENSLHELFVRCRTYRRFEQTEITEETVRSIIEDARTASCASNLQRLRYVAVLSKETRDAMASLVRFAAYLPPEKGQPKEHERAMAYIVILEPENGGRISDIDMGIAADRIVLSAYEKGIGSCMMLNYDAGKVRELLHIEEGMKPGLVIAMGVPAHTSTIEEAEAGSDLRYYLDEHDDYHVPKLKTEELVRFI